ncbi:MAG TPA: phosphate ABC transporter permease PstA [Solirubrobacteraceae bacterium]|nr:phosphate ABC transporter permease PstA [Solirubrobacteraceae bacterium]
MTAIPLDHARPLTASGNLRRRQRVSRLAEGTATAAAVTAVGLLGVLLWSVVSRGASVLSLDFLTSEQTGIAPEILGTGLIVGAATVMAMPIGVLVALFTTEFAAPRPTRAIRLALDLLNGLPSIVVGLFVFGLLVVGHGQSGFSGSVALAVIMLPLIARSSEEVLALVPRSISEAADALGVSRWRTVLGVMLPTALGGIITGTVLAVARAAGETAPLFLVDSIYDPQKISFNLFGPVPNIPVSIFQASEAADPNGFARAWGEAFVLLVFILVSGLAARILFARSRAKISG